MLAHPDSALVDLLLGKIAGWRAVQGGGLLVVGLCGAQGSGKSTLTKTLAQAFARDGIRVNLVAPGLVRSKMTAVTWEDPERLAATERQVPLARIGEPDDIAGAILFLASPLASYITGTSLIVDGGLSA